MHLNSSPKVFGEGVHRIVSPEDTFERVLPVAREIGITRIADITGLDRIGIPVYSAIMPKSNDVISVYNGKGTRPLDAKVGAIMEGIERFAAWSAIRPELSGSYTELRRWRNMLDPHEIVTTIQEDYTDETPIGWVEGYDLLRQEKIYVPFYAAAYFDGPGDDYGHLCYTVTSANGLASGNSLEEAICHALCEIIERDAWSLAELSSRNLPKYLGKSRADLGAEISADDLERYPTIRQDSITGQPRELLELYEQAGMRIVLRNITSDIGIPTISCTVCDDLHNKFSPAHMGVGTHPDATVALTRALTEAAQSRAVDIQALREDISMADEEVDKAFLHSKRVGKVEGPTFHQTESRHPISFGQIASYRNGDVLDDINLMMDRLRKCELQRVIVVDLSMPELKASVVRVIVPGMESWGAVKGAVGERADALLRETAVEKQREAALRINSQRIMDAFRSRLPGSEPEA
jgi:ribosomal protein S12 methylthiotransferase accessory factor